MIIISIPGRSASAQTSSARHARVSEEEAWSDTAVAKSECLIVALSIMLDDTKYNYIPSPDIHTLIPLIENMRTELYCFQMFCHSDHLEEGGGHTHCSQQSFVMDSCFVVQLKCNATMISEMSI